MLIVIAGLAFSPASARAELIIEQYQWGFDDRVVAGEFNAFSVLAYNAGAEAFEGELTLRASEMGGGMSGARLVQPIYLGAEQRRWVRFHPYITEFGGEWVLSWGRGARQRLPMTEPRLGADMAVLLHDEDRLIVRGARLRVLPESLFPLTAAVMTGLRDVVVDHVPRFDAQRRQALVDWVHGGGRLHVIRGEGGQLPVFDGELAPLNIDGESERIGRGYVFRHSHTTQELDKQALEGMGIVIDTQRDPNALRGNWFGQGLEQMLFPALRALVRPNHNWSAIYLMSLGFLVLIGPVHVFLSRKKLGYRGSIAFLIVTVAVFTWANIHIGRRGFGERTALHSVTFAHALEPGRYDMTRWGNLFVTVGDVYRVQHQGAHHLYAVGQPEETVRGRIHTGASSMFELQMPLFSSHSFLHRGIVAGPGFGAKIVAWEERDDVQAHELHDHSYGDSAGRTLLNNVTGVTVELDAALADQGIEVWAVYGRAMAKCGKRDGVWRATFDDDDDVRRRFSEDELWRYGYGYYGGWDDDDRMPVGEAARQAYIARKMKDLSNVLIAHELGVVEQLNVIQLRTQQAQTDGGSVVFKPLTAANEVTLLVLAPGPEDWRALPQEGQPYEAQVDFVVYRFDLFDAGRPAGYEEVANAVADEMKEESR